jgi:hypothetical protein
MYLHEEVMMLKKEAYSVIKALAEHGVYQKDIAEKLRVHPKTVSRALKRGGAPERTRKAKGSKLDPYKPTIDRLLSEGVWNAVVILREIQAEGYDGEISSLAGGLSLSLGWALFSIDLFRWPAAIGSQRYLVYGLPAALGFIGTTVVLLLVYRSYYFNSERMIRRFLPAGDA